MRWLLDLVYLVALAAVSPVLAWRFVFRGKYRNGWGEKFLGRVPRRVGGRACLWFHAVSVGEVLQLEPVLEGLRQRLPRVEFVISTTTATGRSVAEARFPDDRVCYCPLDFSWAVREAFHRLRPTAIVLVELELWPNLILHSNRSGVPIGLVNGRISEKSSRGYSRLRPLLARLLKSFEFLAVQNAIYAERFIRLGAPASRVSVTGSIKFDRIMTDRENPRTAELRRFFDIRSTQRVFIAGSTQAPEESFALDAYESLRPKFPELRLILVPRHKERFEAVAQLVRRRGFSLVRRSGVSDARAQSDGDGTLPVLLLDTLGELAACWGLADVAFVGGSLTNRGGQNMIEPAGYGAAVLFGPNTQNFRDVVEILLAENAARVVRDAAELTAAIAEHLANPIRAGSQGARAQTLVLANQGAAARTIDLIAGLACFDRFGTRNQAA